MPEDRQKRASPSLTLKFECADKIVERRQYFLYIFFGMFHFRETHILMHSLLLVHHFRQVHGCMKIAMPAHMPSPFRLNQI